MIMKRILILGGYGLTGRPLARHLLERTNAELILVGRRLAEAQSFANQLNSTFEGGRVSARRADAASRPELLAALQGVDLMIVAAPTTHHVKTVVCAALEAGVDYLDVQLEAGKAAYLKTLAPEIERAGRCFITEAGFHPGLPSAMVRYAAAQLDRLDTALVAGYLSLGRALPYSQAVDELMEVFKNYQAQVYKNRGWTRPNSYDIRTVDFGGKIGVRRCYSMFVEELRDLPVTFPSLQELGFYVSESGRVADWVITPLVMAGLKVAPQRGLHPLGRLMWWGLQTFSRPPYMVLIKVEAEGERGGKPFRIEASVSHLDGYELTAIPVAACLLQYLDGPARRLGLWMMGHLVEPVRFFDDMQQMGASVSAAADEMGQSPTPGSLKNA
jgi:hypothetical protein